MSQIEPDPLQTCVHRHNRPAEIRSSGSRVRRVDAWVGNGGLYGDYCQSCFNKSLDPDGGVAPSDFDPETEWGPGKDTSGDGADSSDGGSSGSAADDRDPGRDPANMVGVGGYGLTGLFYVYMDNWTTQSLLVIARVCGLMEQDQ